MGSLAPVSVCAQAIYNRLAKYATAVMPELWAQISTWLWQWMAPYEDHQLAPFATRIYALDESTMRSIKRWLKQVPDGPLGDPCLLAGRLIGLFDIGRPQWVRLDWLAKAIANCQVHAEAMLKHIELGAVLLFDARLFPF